MVSSEGSCGGCVARTTVRVFFMFIDEDMTCEKN